MLTTMSAGRMTYAGKESHRMKKPIVNVELLTEYSSNVGPSSRYDMMLSSLCCMIKSIKRYNKGQFHVTRILLLNAHIMYLAKNREHVPPNRFQLTPV
jgi:hypothetical protein